MLSNYKNFHNVSLIMKDNDAYDDYDDYDYDDYDDDDDDHPHTASNS